MAKRGKRRGLPRSSWPNRLARAAILVTPAALIAYWGGAYLFDAAQTLLAPGAGIELAYATPRGPLRISARTYAVDPVAGVARLEGLRVVSPDGRLLASVDRARVEGLDVANGVRPRVFLESPRLAVARGAKGEIDLAGYLPKSEGPPSDVPYEVQIVRGRLDVRDDAARDPKTGKSPLYVVRLPQMHLAGRSGDLVAHGSVVLPDLGRATLSLFRDAAGNLDLRGEAPRLDAARLLQILRAGPERRLVASLDGARAERLGVRGTFSLDLPAGGKARFRSDLVANGTSLAFRDERLARATFRGVVTERGVRGQLVAADGGDRVAFDGAAIYADPKRPAVGGTLDAALTSSDRLRRYLPTDLRSRVAFRDGRFRGVVAYADQKPAVQGDLSVATARYDAEVARGASATLAFARDRLDVRSLRTSVRGAALSGGATIGVRDRSVLAYADAPGLSDRLARPYAALPDLRVTGDASLLARGTFDRPVVQARANVAGSYRLPNGTRLTFAPYAIDLGGGRDGAQIGRLALSGPYGTLVATGGYAPAGGLDLALSAKGIDLRRIDGQARGRADLVGRVRGSLADPRFTGRVEGYGIGTEAATISAIGADIVADRRRIAVNEVTALKGAGKVEGSAALALDTKAISGRFSAEGLQLSDITKAEVVGRIDVPSLVIGGTLSRPVARGQIQGTQIVAADTRIPTASARIAVDRSGASIAGAKAEVAGGTVTGGARYAFATGAGEFSGEFDDVRAGRLLARRVPQAEFRGRLDGTYAGTIRGGQLSAARVQATADELALNRVALGAGTLSATYAGGRFRTDVEVGQLARFLAARGVTYDPETGALGGRLEVLGLPIPEIVAAASPALSDASVEVRSRLASLTGSVALGAELGGTTRAPVIDLQSLDATGVALGGTAYGDLALAGTYADGGIVLREAKLTGPNGTATAGGVISRDGTLDLRLDANNLAAELLRPFAPGVAGYDARIESGTFEIGGTLRAPEARGSLLGYAALPQGFRAFEPKPQGLTQAEEIVTGTPQASRLNANLFDIRLTPGPDGTLSLGTRGLFSVVGFTGDVSADVPLGGGPDAPIAGSVTLRPRKLSDVAAYFPGLAVKGDVDEVSGNLVVGGTLRAPTASGTVSAKATEVSYQGVTTRLQNPIIELGLNDRRLELNASTTSSYGGALQANLATSIADLLGGDPLPDALARSVAGTVRMDGLRILQRFPDGGDVDARVTTTVPLSLSGTLRQPRIAGALAIGKLETTLPTLGTGEGSGAGLPIDPIFDLSASIENTAKIRSSAAEFELDGGGTVQGALSALRANADLAVQKGSLRLPGGTVRIDPGGTLDFTYAATSPNSPLGASAARLETDLVGRTSVTALRDGVNTERYDITIDVRGDLLAPNGLTLNARSDPPDLSQERILAILGQTDVITGFLDTGDRRRLESELRTALTGYALPGLLGGFTNSLARGFGLDYLTLDYNAFDQASIVFARSLGRGLTFSGRRQLSPPQAGFPQRYDLRLGYRPRRGAGYLKDISLSVGADDERPYKVSLEYGIRFGSVNPPLRTYRLGVKEGGGR